MKKVFIILSEALLAAALLLSCTGGKENANASPRTLTLSQTELNLHVGDARQLEATVLPQEALDKTVKWTSTNAQRVSVEANGLVRAVSVGTAYVVAETVNGIKASCLVRVSASETDVYNVRIYSDGQEAPETFYGWPGKTVQLEARSDDGKTHGYLWSSSSESTVVENGLVTFGWEQRDDAEAYAWYSEAVIRVASEDGCYSSVNAVSSIGRSFLFGPTTGTVGSDVTILAGKEAEVKLTWFDGNAFTALPDDVEYTLVSQDGDIASVTGHKVLTSSLTVGSTTLSVIMGEKEFLLCNLNTIN